MTTIRTAECIVFAEINRGQLKNISNCITESICNQFFVVDEPLRAIDSVVKIKFKINSRRNSSPEFIKNIIRLYGMTALIQSR